jgi:hypothetical protein
VRRVCGMGGGRCAAKAAEEEERRKAEKAARAAAAAAYKEAAWVTAAAEVRCVRRKHDTRERAAGGCPRLSANGGVVGAAGVRNGRGEVRRQGRRGGGAPQGGGRRQRRRKSRRRGSRQKPRWGGGGEGQAGARGAGWDVACGEWPLELTGALRLLRPTPLVGVLPGAPHLARGPFHSAGCLGACVAGRTSRAGCQGAWVADGRRPVCGAARGGFAPPTCFTSPAPALLSRLPAVPPPRFPAWQVEEDDGDSGEAEDRVFCVACDKYFKSDKQLKNHERLVVVWSVWSVWRGARGRPNGCALWTPACI